MAEQTVIATDSDVTRQHTEQTSRFFALVRTIGLIGIAGSLVAFELLGALPFTARPALLIILPVYFVVSLAIWFLVRRSAVPEWPLIAQLVTDALVLAVGIDATGGLSSPFLPLFFVILISASLVSLRGLLVVGALLLAAFGMTVLRSPAGSMSFFSETVFVLMLALIGLQTYLLIRLIRQRDRALEKLKEEFLFRTVHDIRSPSTIIRYASELLRDVQLPAEATEQLRQIESANLRINGMVSELMAVARGESGAMTLKVSPVPVVDTIQKLLVALKQTAMKREVSLSVLSNGEVRVMADLLRFQEVFTNLVDNAIKYNRRGGSVTLSVAREAKVAVISVHDTGIGIKDENKASLFTPYFREVRDPSVGGTGLGLYGVKKLVESMQGNIRYETQLDEGTTFIVSLPLAPEGVQ